MDYPSTPGLLPFKDKDSQRPSTITMQAVAPNQEAVDKLAAALKSEELGKLASPMQLFVGPTGESPAELTVRLNWKPLGRFRPGLEAAGGLLRSLQCTELRFWYESGPRVEE